MTWMAPTATLLGVFCTLSSYRDTEILIKSIKEKLKQNKSYEKVVTRPELKCLLSK